MRNIFSSTFIILFLFANISANQFYQVEGYEKDTLKIEEIKAELKLQNSKLVDKKTAVRMGKLMGASHLIAGSVTVLDQQMRLDLRPAFRAVAW